MILYILFLFVDLLFFIDDTVRWNPQNWDGSTSLLETMRYGLKKSLNLVDALKEIFIEIRSSKVKSTILFSPGCSSFDQYKNFEDRGNKFKEFVMKEMIKYK